MCVWDITLYVYFIDIPNMCALSNWVLRGITSLKNVFLKSPAEGNSYLKYSYVLSFSSIMLVYVWITKNYQKHSSVFIYRKVHINKER